jgi:hypothetical protein
VRRHGCVPTRARISRSSPLLPYRAGPPSPWESCPAPFSHARQARRAIELLRATNTKVLQLKRGHAFRRCSRRLASPARNGGLCCCMLRFALRMRVGGTGRRDISSEHRGVPPNGGSFAAVREKADVAYPMCRFAEGYGPGGVHLALGCVSMSRFGRDLPRPLLWAAPTSVHRLGRRDDRGDPGGASERCRPGGRPQPG